ncbi:uncharacterized protein [Diadema antillarum]|uniref:uncharacterized protein n=1 Tax=Diadema antillarum TaxID=105358 RepID=UPI003A83EDBA
MATWQILILIVVMNVIHDVLGVTTERCSDVCDYYDWGKDADCQHRHLQSIPQECHEAKTLQMQNNRLDRLPAGAFRNYTCLKYLYLERNNMSIDVGAFLGCNHLRKLIISENFLPSLSKELMQGLPMVSYMFIDRAAVRDISTGAFQNLTNLNFLSLKENQLISPPCDAFTENNNLKTLFLSSNKISDLPDRCFADFSGLKQLILTNNPLEDPNPLAFDGLNNLEVLDLQYTNLSVVPTGIFPYVSSIKKLYLSFNKIIHLENRDFVSLTSLTHLYLHNNHLMTVHPKSFEFLLSLRVLHLSSNQIHSVGEGSMSYSNELEKVYLQENRLTSTRNVSSVSQEVEIHLADNPLTCDCAISPFKYRLQRSPEDAEQPSSSLATCSTPNELSGRLVKDLSHDDICPTGPGMYPNSAETSKDESNSGMFVDSMHPEPTKVPEPVDIVRITAIVTAAIVFAVLAVGTIVLYRMKKKAQRKHNLQQQPGPYKTRLQSAPNHQINITENPTPPQLPPRRQSDLQNHSPLPSPLTESSYVSLDGEEHKGSISHPRRPSVPLDAPPKPSHPAADENVIYSKVLPDAPPSDFQDSPAEPELSPADWVKNIDLSPVTKSRPPYGPSATVSSADSHPSAGAYILWK